MVTHTKSGAVRKSGHKVKDGKQVAQSGSAKLAKARSGSSKKDTSKIEGIITKSGEKQEYSSAATRVASRNAAGEIVGESTGSQYARAQEAAAIAGSSGATQAGNEAENRLYISEVAAAEARKKAQKEQAIAEAQKKAQEAVAAAAEAKAAAEAQKKAQESLYLTPEAAAEAKAVVEKQQEKAAATKKTQKIVSTDSTLPFPTVLETEAKGKLYTSPETAAAARATVEAQKKAAEKSLKREIQTAAKFDILNMQPTTEQVTAQKSALETSVSGLLSASDLAFEERLSRSQYSESKKKQLRETRYGKPSITQDLGDTLTAANKKVSEVINLPTESEMAASREKTLSILSPKLATAWETHLTELETSEKWYSQLEKGLADFGKSEYKSIREKPVSYVGETAALYLGGAALGAGITKGSKLISSGLEKVGAVKAASLVSPTIKTAFVADVGYQYTKAGSYESGFELTKDLFVGGAGYKKGAGWIEGRIDVPTTAVKKSGIIEPTERSFKVLTGIEKTEITTERGTRSYLKLKTADMPESKLSTAEIKAFEAMKKQPQRSFSVEYDVGVTETKKTISFPSGIYEAGETKAYAGKGIGEIELGREIKLGPESMTLTGERLPSAGKGAWYAEMKGIPTQKGDLSRTVTIEDYLHGPRSTGDLLTRPTYEVPTKTLKVRAKILGETTETKKELETFDMRYGLKEAFEGKQRKQATISGFDIDAAVRSKKARAFGRSFSDITERELPELKKKSVFENIEKTSRTEGRSRAQTLPKTEKAMKARSVILEETTKKRLPGIEQIGKTTIQPKQSGVNVVLFPFAASRSERETQARKNIQPTMKIQPITEMVGLGEKRKTVPISATTPVQLPRQKPREGKIPGVIEIPTTIPVQVPSEKEGEETKIIPVPTTIPITPPIQKPIQEQKVSQITKISEKIKTPQLFPTIYPDPLYGDGRREERKEERKEFGMFGFDYGLKKSARTSQKNGKWGAREKKHYVLDPVIFVYGRGGLK